MTGPTADRRRMLGDVRTASLTRAAPPVATSCAISMAEQPDPTTSTSAPRNGMGLRYSAECRSWPENVSRPGQAGITGVWA